MKSTNPIVRDLVLLGGGHTHVIVIRMWAMNPIPGVRVTLISQDTLTPYSGMLPGLVAGHYSMEQSHIDLGRLCKWAGVRFVEATALGVAPESNTVQFAQRPPLSYDFLSIDTGGVPRLTNVEGAEAFTTPVKPVHQFYKKWQEIEQRVRSSDQPLRIGVVGAGAGGFEILLAMQYRIENLLSGNSRHQFHWIIRGQILSGHPKRIKTTAQKICRQREVICHRNFDVAKVEKGRLIHRNSQELELDEVLWCTEAQAPPWPFESGLECTPDGYIAITDTLQSVSHSNVFAAGDVAVQLNHPRPRAGVFAVRQGPVLLENLQRVIKGKRPKTYRPQTNFLTLLSTGDKSAIGSKGTVSMSGGWVWHWKDWIDQRFMNRFNVLAPMAGKRPQPLPQQFVDELPQTSGLLDMRCGGCGAKVGSNILERVLTRLVPVAREDQLSGLAQSDDVAVIDPGNQLLAQSVDQIRSLVDDPWMFARIATVHALSDLYAAGATPQSAMALVGLPFASDLITERELSQIMAGIVKELNAAGCTLSGGHTSEMDDLSVGFAVNGYLDKLQTHQAIEPGQQLILTKPIGAGVLMAAHMRLMAKGLDVSTAIGWMLQSNAMAGSILVSNNVTAMTDVTGFGLIGHLVRLLQPHGVSCQIAVSQVPCLNGAVALSEAGVRSSLFNANQFASGECKLEAGIDKLPAFALLFDPQTSGGLVATVPEMNTAACINALCAAGYQAAIIGKITPPNDYSVEIIDHYEQ